MANEKRLIDANDAFEIVTDLAGQADTKGAYKAFWEAARAIQKMPTVDAVEVVHGQWEKSEIPNEEFCCSVCGGACWYYDVAKNVAKSSYCPNCGAKMDKED